MHIMKGGQACMRATADSSSTAGLLLLKHTTIPSQMEHLQMVRPCQGLSLGQEMCHTFLLPLLKKSVTGLRPPEAGVAGVAGVRLPYTGLLVMKSF